MYIFAIESSCDETAAAILRAQDEKITLLSNVVSSQIEIHALYGGVVPEIASRAHCEAISGVAREAVDTAGISLSDLNAVAVTFAPGLIGSLLVGVSFAKALAMTLNVPLIPVNHIEAHVAAAYLENENLKPPYLALVVSGGHTSLYEVSDYVTFHEIGGTRDDACGEAFDKVGRVMGLPYPGGAAMDRIAAVGLERYDPRAASALKFPSPAVADDTLDFSFSGLKTAVINYIHTEKQRLKSETLPDEKRCEIAAAFTAAVCEGVTKKLGRALEITGAKTLVMAGGVAANSHLRKAVGQTCEKHGVRFVTPSIRLCGDNAAMTAAAGYHMYRMGLTADLSLNAYASDEAAEEYRTGLFSGV
ncbi:MAG: tRNA (adenosine(37)-N6)-threonylcarbamoyltransferase complex transferase subunit TsaD [Eubacteriales bacterium]